MTKFIILFLLSFSIYSQPSIDKTDIEVTTQLTFLKVAASSEESFRRALSTISTLSKKIALNEKYDWLTYRTGDGEYLIITFGSGLKDVLTVEDYLYIFSNSEEAYSYGTALSNLAACHMIITRNFLQEMVLPWSTVDGISVAENPYTSMTEYTIPSNYLGSFDQLSRMLVSLLKEVKFPYPLEGNRGGIGSYGKTYHVWFYDQHMTSSLEEYLEKWMEKNERLDEYLAIKNAIDDLAINQTQTNLTYSSTLSY